MLYFDFYFKILAEILIFFKKKKYSKSLDMPQIGGIFREIKIFEESIFQV
jgi:hypothetical protein